MSIERLKDEVLNNAIKTYEISSKIDDPDYSTVLDKCVLEFLYELKEYRNAEEQGLLIRLPCNIGDTIFRINQYAKEPIISMKVFQVLFCGMIGQTFLRIDAINDEDIGESSYFKNDIGRKVFLTREEAEAALAEMENMEV